MNIRETDTEQILWQAHRGGGGAEMPDNTLASLNFGWNLGGIPEVDIRLTADGKLVCLHDSDLSRTTDAPEAVAHKKIPQLSLAEIQKYDAGARFSEAFRGEKIPAFHEVLELLHADPAKMIYADLKTYRPSFFPALKQEFITLINKYELIRQIIVCSSDYNFIRQMREAVPRINTMQWIGGNANKQIATFESLAGINFNCLDQVQLHLNDRNNHNGPWRYTLEPAFLQKALKVCANAGISLQVFPWQAEKKDYFKLLELGIRWFATDEPSKLCNVIKEWQGK
ncbi:MAG: glycerophosphodiester phosphodiesterase family protein [Victivallales bacterium]|nr:glycerophosphodiester phosphodiesterase family protein [Victivallales bacterium]